MKSTIVPAQVTTVEDRITASLTVTQLLILITPICLCGVLYVFCPINFKFSAYKIVILSTLSPTIWVLSLRVKGKLVVNWLSILVRYASRPKYYIFDKNDPYQRVNHDVSNVREKSSKRESETIARSEPLQNRLPNLEQVVLLELLIGDPKNTLSIQLNNDGGLYAAIEEVK